MIFIGLAILFFGAAIWLLIQYIKSFKGVKIDGIIIDNVEGYTEEYFKYLPEYKEKHDKFQSQLESLGNTLNTNIAEDTKTHDRVFIVEYIVNGEKYYFEVPIDSISAHYKIGDTYMLRYDPTNPKKAYDRKRSFIGIIVLAILGGIFLMLYFLDK